MLFHLPVLMSVFYPQRCCVALTSRSLTASESFSAKTLLRPSIIMGPICPSHGAFGMNFTRRDWLGGAGALSATISSPLQAQIRPLKVGSITPERFGALGDGRTNDTAAFAKMAAVVTRQGGAVIELRPTTYIVGLQANESGPLYAYKPASIMHFVGCSGPLIIKGNGARLRCADGLRFGTFDPATGEPTHHNQPYYGHGELSSPYFAMIEAEGCSGYIEISDVELDGNLAGHKIGGGYDATGWQIPCSGLVLRNNVGREHITRVHTHHHALDGFLIDGPSARNTSSLIQDCTSDYNARQGCSIVGGRNYAFENCHFRHTGKARIMSAPGAGVDIEAEGSKIVRNLRFQACEFSDNAGAGLVASVGDSKGAAFESCLFIGTTSWSAWPGTLGFRFSNCEFVGSIVNARGHADPTLATQFHNCLFRDDPSLSPTGKIYAAPKLKTIAQLPFAENVLFRSCGFELTHGLVLPWSANGAIYEACTMSQVATKTAYPRGIYRGRNRINGPVDLSGSHILGDLYVNGQRQARTG